MTFYFQQTNFWLSFDSRLQAKKETTIFDSDSENDYDEDEADGIFFSYF